MGDVKPKIGNSPPKRGDLKKDELGVDIQNANLYIGLSDGNPLLLSGDGATWTNPDPTTAQDVDGIPSGTTVPIGTNAISILESILYPEYGVSFTNLNTGLPSSSELGVNLQNPNATITWNTTGVDENWVPNSLNITYSQLVAGTLLTNGNPLAKTASVIYPSTFRATSLSNNSLRIQLQGQQNVSGIISSVSISSTNNWWSRIFWGRSSNENLLNVTSLSSQLVQSKGTISLSLNSSNQPGYFYIFVYAGYDVLKLTVEAGGFSLGVRPEVGSVILSRNGLNLPYKVYRSGEFLNPPQITILTDLRYNNTG